MASKPKILGVAFSEWGIKRAARDKTVNSVYVPIGGVDVSKYRHLFDSIYTFDDFLNESKIDRDEISARLSSAISEEFSGAGKAGRNICGIPIRYFSNYAFQVSILTYMAIQPFRWLANEYDEVLIYAPKKYIASIEDRPDIKMLYFPESWAGGIFYKSLVDIFPVVHSRVEGSIYLVLFKSAHVLRQFIVRSYIFSTVIWRSLKYRYFSSFSFKNAQSKPSHSLAIVRCGTELNHFLSILENGSDFQNGEIITSGFALYGDELIKSPDLFSTASQRNIFVASLHKKTSILDVAYAFLSGSEFKRIPDSHGSKSSSERDIILSALMTTARYKPELILFSKQVGSILDELKPRNVIYFDFIDRWGAVIAYQAKIRSIQSVCIQNTSLDERAIPEPSLADIFIVNNTKIASKIDKKGKAKNKIFPIGLPSQDKLISHGNESHKYSYKARKTIIVATQPFLQTFPYNEQLILSIIDSVQEIPEICRLIIKPHPRENANTYKGIVKHIDGGKVSISVETDNIEKLILESDIFISRTSTAINTAILLGVPAISYLDSYPKDILSQLFYLGQPTICAHTKKDLESAIRDANNDSKLRIMSEYRDLYLREHCGSDSGKAASKVLSLLSS